MKYGIKSYILSFLMVFLIVPIFAYATRIQTYNGEVISVATNGAITIRVDNGTTYPDSQRFSTYTVTPTTGTYVTGDIVSFSVNEDLTPSQVVASTVKIGANANANKGTGSQSSTTDFRLFKNLNCNGNNTLVCWLGEVWRFSQVAILVLAVAAIVMAGIIYMTSAGNPKQIAMAKKVIVGALTGVAVMVMGKFFLVNIIGVEWIW